MLPVPGFLMAVHDCQDQDEMCLDGVQNGVGKNSGQAAPHVVFQDRVVRRMLGKFADGCFHAEYEALSESGLRLRVVAGSVLEFGKRVWVKGEVHRTTRRRTRSSASVPGMGSTSPRRISSRRRTASAAQSARISRSCAGSRLSISRSASRARASLGSDSAASVSCSIEIAMRSGYAAAAGGSIRGCRLQAAADRTVRRALLRDMCDSGTAGDGAAERVMDGKAMETTSCRRSPLAGDALDLTHVVHQSRSIARERAPTVEGVDAATWRGR